MKSGGAKSHELIVLREGLHVVVDHAQLAVGLERRQFVEVRREEREGFDVLADVPASVCQSRK